MNRNKRVHNDIREQARIATDRIERMNKDLPSLARQAAGRRIMKVHKRGAKVYTS